MCLETLMWVVYLVSIPCHLDHSYAAEVYTSWILCRVKRAMLASTHVACATTHSLRESSDFTDSKSFILALRSRRPEVLVDLLLADYNEHATHFPAPQHLYSHHEGTFLDLVLDDVDREAMRQPHPMPAGYLAVLQTPQPTFCRDGVQWHDVSTLQSRQLHRLYAT